MDFVFRNFRAKVIQFGDEIFIVFNTVEKQFQHLEDIFQTCGDRNITFNLTKRTLLEKKLNLLGHILSIKNLKSDSE